MKKEEERYLDKKLSELNVHEKRFREMMRLMRIQKMLDKAEITHKKIPQDGYLLMKLV